MVQFAREKHLQPGLAWTAFLLVGNLAETLSVYSGSLRTLSLPPLLSPPLFLFLEIAMRSDSLLFLLFVLLCLLFTGSVGGAWTLEEVRARGVLRCGVGADSGGFSRVDENGQWRGLDVDLCRAVAAAALGDAEKVEFVPFAATGGVTALLSAKVDLLASHHQQWSFTGETALALNFTAVSWYDRLGMAVVSEPGGNDVDSAELANVKLCLQSGESGWRAKSFFEKKGVATEDVLFESGDAAVEGLIAGRCNLLVRPLSQLQALALEHRRERRLVILPDTLGRVAWGPLVRQGDDPWLVLVRWSLFAMIDAEALGITSQNIDEMARSSQPAVARFLGRGATSFPGVGLSAGWTGRIIRQVGNYGESVERNLGDDSVLPLERGENRLWKDGGLIYAPPIE